MKRCPKCESTRVITFDSDNDWCIKCKKYFPAVAEIKCETGCKAFTGGEIKHHKDCYFYPESFTKMYDDLKQKDKDRDRDITRIIVEIQAEMLKNVGKPNFGKNGCLIRLEQLLKGEFKGTSEEIYSKEPIEKVIVPKSLITNLANDIWMIAKRIKKLAKDSQDLKTISLCLHDIGGERKTEWYHKARKEIKKRFSSKRVL